MGVSDNEGERIVSLHTLTPAQLRRALASPAGPRIGVAPRIQMRTEKGGLIVRPTAPPPGQEARTAAVLVLLYPGPAGLTVALTRRTNHLPTHAGQISCPGGAADPEDPSLYQTALREAREELGVETEGLEFLAELRTIYIPPSNFLVHPFVAYADHRPSFHPNTEEVEAVLEVPLAHLADPDNLFSEVRDLREGRLQISYFRFGSDKIWGATALLLDDLLSRLEAGAG
mgnify:CR=1 FL=1